VSNQENNKIVIWLEGSIQVATTISGNLSYPYALFVTTAGDVYVDNGYANGRVNKWAINATIGVPVMYVDKECYGLFVDISDTLYCSIGDRHQVVAKSLNSGSNTVVAGDGCPGSASNMLYFPRGIFVDTNLDLYVADCGNNRIQVFHLGQLIGLTVAVNGTSGAFTLSCPTGIVLDADKYLFIVDSINHRIIGSGPNGFRCIVGCSGSSGSASNQLINPQSMAFDSYGNIYVTDQNNHRIQKFVKVNNNGGKCDRRSQITYS
jgi:hypothetical protein